MFLLILHSKSTEKCMDCSAINNKHKAGDDVLQQYVETHIPTFVITERCYTCYYCLMLSFLQSSPSFYDVWYYHCHTLKLTLVLSMMSYKFLNIFLECRDGDILLYNGTTLSTEHSNGTVVVCYDNEYGTVCDDFWDVLDAMVVCTFLGFESNGMQSTHL